MGQGMVKGLAHIGIYVKDIAASIDFYKRLGFTLDNEADVGIRLAFMSAGTCLIELIEKKEDVARGAGVIEHIAITVDDIEAAVAAANSNGIAVDASKIHAMPLLGGVKNVFFAGPDGEGLEFFEYTSK